MFCKLERSENLIRRGARAVDNGQRGRYRFIILAKLGIRDAVVTVVLSCLFFFQAEDGIRDADVTGVQTCALPISFACMVHQDQKRTPTAACTMHAKAPPTAPAVSAYLACASQHLVIAFPTRRRRETKIGRASCRERV